jgi:hypothetical protein
MFIKSVIRWPSQVLEPKDAMWTVLAVLTTGGKWLG